MCHRTDHDWMLVDVTCVEGVSLSIEDDVHGHEVILTTSQQHVPRRRDVGLEVVRHGWVVTLCHGLESIVPPGEEGGSVSE